MSNEWKGDEFLKKTQKELGDNLEKAAIFLKGQVKQALNTSQDRERYVGESGVYYKGLDPSTPGEAPHKLTGFLQRSIAHKMSEDRQQAFVGTNLDYGFWQEFGTSKQAARPFLRPTLAAHQATIAKIVATGKA